MTIVNPLNDAVRCLKRQLEKGKEDGKIESDVPLRVRMDLYKGREAFNLSLVDNVGNQLPETRAEEGVFVITGTGPANHYENPIYYSPDEEGVLVAENQDRIYTVVEAIQELTRVYGELKCADSGITFRYKVEVDDGGDSGQDERYRIYLLGPGEEWLPMMYVDDKSGKLHSSQEAHPSP